MNGLWFTWGSISPGWWKTLNWHGVLAMVKVPELSKEEEFKKKTLKVFFVWKRKHSWFNKLIMLLICSSASFACSSKTFYDPSLSISGTWIKHRLKYISELDRSVFTRLWSSYLNWKLGVIRYKLDCRAAYDKTLSSIIKMSCDLIFSTCVD